MPVQDVTHHRTQSSTLWKTGPLAHANNTTYTLRSVWEIPGSAVACLRDSGLLARQPRECQQQPHLGSLSDHIFADL
ncbi:hypothetical protein SK128_025939, partial [Halocaridina rubra]